jgi:hypothetical protein
VVQILCHLAADRTALEENATAYQAFIEENYSMDAYTRRMDETIASISDAELATGIIGGPA